jgi:ABC-type sugar transport system substrate-binding protein
MRKPPVHSFTPSTSANNRKEKNPMRKTTALALTLTAALAVAQPALAAKSQPAKGRTSATQQQRDGNDAFSAVKKFVKKFLGQKSAENLVIPIPKQP